VVFPMAPPGRRRHAGAMDTTTVNPAPGTQGQHETHGPHETHAPHETQGLHETHAQEEARAQASRPLYRPVEDRMLAGVAAGAARYLGVDVTVVRIVLAVLAVMGGAGVPIYLAGWLLIPDEDAGQSIATEFIRSLQSRSH